MDSETKRIKNEKDLVDPNNKISQPSPIMQQNIIQVQPNAFYQNIQFPQQPGIQQYPQQQFIINQPIIYQQQYGQPVIIQQNGIIDPNQPNIIVNNQVLPMVTPIKWTINPRLVICPFCQKNIKTRVEKEFSPLTCCIWASCIILLPLLLLAAASGGGCAGDCCSKKKEEEKKDETEVIEKNDECCICCYDGTHYCPECGKVLGIYKSCSKQNN